jgi:ribonuclease-3
MSEKTMTFNSNETLSAVFMQRNMDTKVSDFSHLVSLLESSPQILTLCENLNYQFKNSELLFTALEHSSFGHEVFGDSAQSYETLEFLGDSVLGLIITECLQERFPKLTEGMLSKFRASLVNEESLGKLAKTINLQSAVLVGKGEYKNAGHERSSVLSDVFEALLGAIYKDSGLVAAKSVLLFVIDAFEKSTKSEFFNLDNIIQFDSKTRLQELTMALYKSLPKYKSTEVQGNLFELELLINNEICASGTFASKKKGQRELAAKVLKQLEKENK